MHLHALHALNHPPLTSQGFSPGQGARGEAMAGMRNERREACVHGVALGNSVRKATQQTSFCSKCRNALVSSCWRCLLGAVVAPWMVANKASCAIISTLRPMEPVSALLLPSSSTTKRGHLRYKGDPGGTLGVRARVLAVTAGGPPTVGKLQHG